MLRVLALIILMGFVGYGLLALNFVGWILGFGIIAGLLIEVLIRLNDLDYRLLKLAPKRDKVKAAVESYHEENKSL